MQYVANREGDIQISDQATLLLPSNAYLPSIKLAMLNGRDYIAGFVKHNGWDAFEKPLPAVFFRTAHQWPGLVIDVGANTGFYSLLAAAAHKRNRILAFEPMPEILAALDHNVRINGVQGRVRLIRCAVGDRNGTAPLYVPLQDHGLVETSASLRHDFKPQHSATISVLQRTLDRVLLRPSLMMRPVSLIKIDVEGYESAVLAGAHRTIARHRPVVFVEVLRKADMTELNGFMDRHAYVDVLLRADTVLTVSTQVTHDDQAWNHAFVPTERLNSFLTLANDCAAL